MVNGYSPTTLKEALAIRAREDVTPYAGGTDLMVRPEPGRTYLFLRNIPELRRITADENYIRIGAAVTFTEALESELVPKLMKRALAEIAAPAIRNAGTFGGNLGNGSPKADSVLIEYVLDASIRLVSAAGERILPVERFYLGRQKLDLRPDELIAEILLPRPGGEWTYQKVGGRNALAISRVSFAGVFEAEEGAVRRIAVAFGAVAGTVLRFKDLEAMLTGKTVKQARAMREDFLKAYSDRLVLTEGRVSAEYRKTVCLKLLEDFLQSHGV